MKTEFTNDKNEFIFMDILKSNKTTKQKQQELMELISIFLAYYKDNYENEINTLVEKCNDNDYIALLDEPPSTWVAPVQKPKRERVHHNKDGLPK